MKWFFALNEESPFLDIYSKLIKVAVVSALENTTLTPVFIFHGQPNELTDWATSRGVEVIFRYSSFHAELRALQALTGNQQVLEFGPGVYLRMEIPDICLERNWANETVLYTDCDVMFLKDVEPLSPSLGENILGMASESDRDDPLDANSGVIVMDISKLRYHNPHFKQFVSQNLAPLARGDWVLPGYWDQPAYRYYFRHGWAHMSPTLNWKPYWGLNNDAAIIHFHGPKPTDKERAHPRFKDLATSAYFHYTEIWDAMLARAGE